MEHSELVKQLLSILHTRAYEPGERIPSERELSVRFGVARGQIREAISNLEALRIVERRPKSGLFMADEEPSLEALALFARIGVPLSPEDVRQTVEMRRIHEVEAVRLASARRTTDNIEQMRDILASTLEHIEEPEAVANYDRMFHTEIVRATQNALFLRIVNIFYLMTAERRVAYFQDTRVCRRSYDEHHQIFEAVVASDAPRAVELILAHLQGVDSYWRDLIETKPPIDLDESKASDAAL